MIFNKKMSDWEFPQYRKYVSLDIWYKITSAEKFVEIKPIGEEFLKIEIHADRYPEKLRIQDMLECLDDRWEIIEEEEYRIVESGLD